MKPSFYFSIVSATIVILSLQVAQVDAAPTHRQSFEQWCLQKRQFKDEMQRVLMKQRILRKEYDSQVIFWVCD